MRTAWFVALFLAGCASQAEKTAARDAWGDCVRDAVQRLDDGHTDPVSLAVGIGPQCALQYGRLTDAMTSGYITAAGQANMRIEMRANEIRLITAAIIAHRAPH